MRHRAWFTRYLIMGSLMVAVVGVQGYSSALAKKGTSTDITLYNLKKGEDTVTLIEPDRYPERLAPLFFAASEAKKAIVVVDELSATLGESLVMLQCCGVSSGYFVLRNYVQKEKIEPIIKGTILEKYEFLPDDANVLREKLLTDAAQQKPAAATVGTVPVDHAFNVKGVGVVVLGVVVNGSITKHAVMNALPGVKKAQVRSIQKHDEEFDSAVESDRVGLALRNVEVEDVDRGTVLTTDPTIKASKTLKTKGALVKYWQTPIKAGMVIHIGHWMQFLNSKVDEVSDEGDWHKPTLTLTLEKELVYRPGDKAVLMYLEGGKLRVAGTIDLP
jgi:selenocysteine-specific translation elongation factor